MVVRDPDSGEKERLIDLFSVIFTIGKNIDLMLRFDCGGGDHGNRE